MNTTAKYPLHETLKAHEHESLVLSGFLDTLHENGYEVVKRHECDHGCKEKIWCEQIYDSFPPRNEQLIGLYLDIDPKVLSAEKDAMYQELTAAVTTASIPTKTRVRK